MRVAVTGGAGFVGAHLARYLAARGDSVTCLDVATSSPLLADAAGVDCVRCDVASWADLGHALRDAAPEIVFHVAGILSAAAEERPRAAFAANVLGTRNLLEIAAIEGIDRVVFASTIATYGPGVAATVDEGTAQRPTTMYGISKVFGELLGEWFDGRGELDFRALRLPAVIGAGRGGGGASAYASLAVTEAARGRGYVIPVADATVIPLIHVKDAVRALAELGAADEARLALRTYGVSGFSPRADELARWVRKALPEAHVSIDPDAGTEAIIRTWPERIDDRAARADWGWAPRYDLGAAIADIVAELAEHPAWP